VCDRIYSTAQLSHATSLTVTATTSHRNTEGTKDVQYEVAADICKAAGARLCSKDELYGDVAIGSGCGLDKRLIWTGDKCALSYGKGNLAVRGKGAYNQPDECLVTGQTSNVRCCSDAVARCTFSDRNLNLRMPLVSTPARLK
jgi:hypothetical protein